MRELARQAVLDSSQCLPDLLHRHGLDVQPTSEAEMGGTNHCRTRGGAATPLSHRLPRWIEPTVRNRQYRSTSSYRSSADSSLARSFEVRRPLLLRSGRARSRDAQADLHRRAQEVEDCVQGEIGCALGRSPFGPRFWPARRAERSCGSSRRAC